jgi:hypothetical protein
MEDEKGISRTSPRINKVLLVWYLQSSSTKTRKARLSPDKQISPRELPNCTEGDVGKRPKAEDPKKGINPTCGAY